MKKKFYLNKLNINKKKTIYLKKMFSFQPLNSSKKIIKTIKATQFKNFT